MTIRAVVLGAALASAAIIVAPVWADPPPADKAKDATAKDLFGLAKVWEIQIDMAAKEWEKMQPAGGGMPMFGPPGMRPGAPAPPPGQQPAEKNTDVHRGGSFGIEYPYAHAAVVIDGKSFKDVGLRYKGGGSYVMSNGMLRRNLKVELDHFDTEQRYFEQKKINLNAGAMDPSRLRESLAFAVFRDAGIPTPRTAYAEVTLTVPGKYDKEFVGMYTVIEQVDRNFLKSHFKSNKGLLLKPEVGRGGMQPPLAYRGEKWDAYQTALLPKNDVSKKDAQRFIAFTKLINQADDAQFQKEIASYLDVDQFLRFLGVTAFLSNLDSFFTGGHNAYIYLNPDNHKFVFIPWDLDLAFGGFFLFGSAEQQAGISLTHPYAGENKLVDRLLGIKEFSDKYQVILKELTTTSFAKATLLKNLEIVESATKEILAREKKATEARKERAGGMPFGPPGMMGQPTDIRTFIDKRSTSITAQLDGKSKGTIPASSFGFGGRPGGPGGPGGPGMRPGAPNFLTKAIMEALDTNKDGKLSKDELIAGVKKFFAECDKEKTGVLEEKQLADGITRVFPAIPGFGPPPDGAAPPPAPGGFGPGMFMAPALIRRADADKDNKLTLAELLATLEILFKEADKDKKGLLTETQLAEGFRLLFPPPPGFGRPPGGPPPMPPKSDKPEEKKP